MQTKEQVMERRLLLTQVLSGVVFSIFLLVHLCNQMLAALGPAAYDGAQQTLRRGYQASGVELFLVLVPMLVHAVAAVWRMKLRRGQGRSPGSGLRARLHRYSGMFLLVFFLGHTIATRGASYFYGVFPGFEGLSFTFRWVPLYFWPYYTLLALSGLYHLLYGWSVALPVLGFRSASGLRRPLVLGVLVVIAGVLLLRGLLGLGGVLFDVGCPEHGPYAGLLHSQGLYDGSDAKCR